MAQRPTYDVFPLAPWEQTVQQTHEVVSVYGQTVFKGTENQCIKECAVRLAHKILTQ